MEEYRHFIETILTAVGEVAHSKFGRVSGSVKESDKQQILTEVDIEIENLLIQFIAARYPTHSILAEESGFKELHSEFIWVIDPIDGTSNYANGIPWYGCMIALLKNWVPVSSGIYLPETNELYSTEKGEGFYKNGVRLGRAEQPKLSETLISFNFDPSQAPEYEEKIITIIKKLGPQVLNLRSTNSAVDYSYTAEGRFSANINFNNKVWDIAAPLLLGEEAGLTVSDIEGKKLDLSLAQHDLSQNYTILAARSDLHSQILSIINS